MTIKRTQTEAEPLAPTRRIFLTISSMWGIAAGLLYFARQSGLTPGWIYFGLFAAGNCIAKGCLLIWNPELFERRHHAGAWKMTWDKVWFAIFLLNVFAIFFIAVRDFDTRAVNPDWPSIAWLSGLAIFVFGWSRYAWCGVANPFFEAAVRIQTDRGHRVIDAGPYAYFRHPGYIGLSAVFLSTPLLLPSYWICILSLTAVLGIATRTAHEDRYLQAELPGYADYATRVRFRMIPGVW